MAALLTILGGLPAPGAVELRLNRFPGIEPVHPHLLPLRVPEDAPHGLHLVSEGIG